MGKDRSEDQVKKDFKDNFWDLYMRSECVSITQFSSLLEMNRQSVDRYINGDRLPDMVATANICKKMNVSADWLLGLSEVSSTSPNIKNTCELTGLSEKAVKKLQSLEGNNKDSVSYALSALIENELFENFMIEFDYFLDTLESLTIDDLQEFVPYSGADGKVELGRNATAMFFRNNVVSIINTICSDKYSEATKKICGDSYIEYVNGDGRKVVIDKETIAKYKPDSLTE